MKREYIRPIVGRSPLSALDKRWSQPQQRESNANRILTSARGVDLLDKSYRATLQNSKRKCRGGFFAVLLDSMDQSEDNRIPPCEKLSWPSGIAPDGRRVFASVNLTGRPR